MQKERVKNIKHIIAIASGKGGVGKSTVAVNVALALAQNGAKVGILDADIYGPSQPIMLNATNIKPTLGNNGFLPVERHGLQSMSIGYLIDGNTPMVWRGPMLGKALHQLLHETDWQALDYLVIDLPPGTGDVQLTLCQKVHMDGVVIVTTPQDLALADVRRACEMFIKLDVPILGVVENMSVYQCTQCGHEEHLFGSGGGETLAKQYDLKLLGSLPLNMQIREMTDNGNPPVVQAPESDYAKSFVAIANNILTQLAAQPKDYGKLFPKVVVEHTKKEG